MKSLRNLLPALGLVFGASLAMAMNLPANPTERYAEDPSSGPEIWYDLTDIEPGEETYHCNELPANTCSRVSPMSTATEVEEGTFVKNGELPPANP